MAWFQPGDYIQLPDDHYDGATSICISRLRKDGDVSDIFSTHDRLAAQAIARITGRASDQPSTAKTVGGRDSGLK